MKTGFSGTFVISWSQTATDGFTDVQPQHLAVGSTWSWSGELVRVDGPADVIRLDGALGEYDIRMRAARVVRRLVGKAFAAPLPDEQSEIEPAAQDASFVVTDGRESYTVTLIPTGDGRHPLAMFVNEIPPSKTDLWVVHNAMDLQMRHDHGHVDGSVICFTPGTWIRTPRGATRIEDLHEGDVVQTKDNGPQEILWRGSRRMTGARLFALPRLRPIRIQAHALGDGEPEDSLLVSPEHKLIVRGAVAQDLFNTDEVLVSAQHLENGDSIAVDLQVREVTYVHLLLPRHEVLWANGIETESFHPASTSLGSLGDDDRARLLSGLPCLETDPFVYGAFARRTLTDSEAALLAHAA